MDWNWIANVIPWPLRSFPIPRHLKSELFLVAGPYSSKEHEKVHSLILFLFILLRPILLFIAFYIRLSSYAFQYCISDR